MDCHPALTKYRGRKGHNVSVTILRDGEIDRITGKCLGIYQDGQRIEVERMLGAGRITIWGTDVRAAQDALQAERDAKKVPAATSRPTDKQVAYALSLIAELGPRWHDTQWGQAIANPDATWVRSRSKAEVSVLITELRIELGHDDF